MKLWKSNWWNILCLYILMNLSLSLSLTHWVVTSPCSLFLCLTISILFFYLTHLSFIPAATDSVLFGNLPKDVYLPLKTENVTANYHSWALTPKVCTISFSRCIQISVLYNNDLEYIKYLFFKDTNVH